MSVEASFNYPSDLNASYPAAGDAKSEGDDHLRGLKTCFKTTFPNVAGAVTPTHTELNYVDGVTSAIQTQINAKGAITGQTWTGVHAFDATTSIGNVSATEISYLDGVSSAIQAQLAAEITARSNADTSLDTLKANLASPAFTGVPTVPTAAFGASGTQAASLDFVNAISLSSALPGQATHAGGVVTTDGATATWADLASQAEMEAGTETGTRAMSPQRVAQAIQAIAGKLFRSARTGNTILAAADRGDLIDVTSGTFSQTFTAAATLADGWYCYIRNSGAGVVTLDPNGGELIDGAATLVLYPGQARLVQCDGTAFYTILSGAVGDHHVVVTTGNGQGGTNTLVRRFTTTQSSAGTAITYADSAANGGSFTINEPGLYAISYLDAATGGAATFGVSINSAQLTTDISSITAANRLGLTNSAGANLVAVYAVAVRCVAGDVLRGHTNAGSTTTANTASATSFTIRKIGP